MEEAKVWRCSERALFWARLGFPVLCAAGGAFVIAGLVGATKLDVGLGFGGMLLVFGGAIQRFTLYPSLEATRTGLTVRNPMFTKTIPWDKVKEISPGYSGLQIQVHGASAVTVWCVQKNNWDMARGRRTRADEVIEEIASFGSGETRRAPAEFMETSDQKTATTRSARIAIAIGGIGLLIYMILQIAREG